MKKYILYLAGLAMALTSCQKGDVDAVESGEVYNSVVAYIPESATKATGDGSQVNRCIMEVYNIDDEANPILTIREIVAVESGAAEFTSRITRNHDYDILLWADAVDAANLDADVHYNTESLTAVKMGPTFKGNDSSRDAFSALITTNHETTESLSATLTRPLSLVRVVTDSYISEENSYLYPSTAEVTYSNVATTFNVKTRDVSDFTEVKSEAAAAVGDMVEGLGGNQPTFQLVEDFLFAEDIESQSDAEVKVNMANGNELTTFSVTDVPIKTNNITTVSGSLLTTTTPVTTTVVTDFDGEEATYDGVFNVSTIAALNETLGSVADRKSVSIYVTESVDGGTVVLPINLAGIELYFQGDVTSALTFEQSADVDCYADLSILFQADVLGNVSVSTPNWIGEISITASGTCAGIIDVDAEEATKVTLTAESSSSAKVSAAVADVVISSASTFTSLVLDAGDAYIYGSVGAVTFDGTASECSVVEWELKSTADIAVAMAVNSRKDIDSNYYVKDDALSFASDCDLSAALSGTISIARSVGDLFKFAEAEVITLASDCKITMTVPVSFENVYIGGSDSETAGSTITISGDDARLNVCGLCNIQYTTISSSVVGYPVIIIESDCELTVDNVNVNLTSATGMQTGVLIDSTDTVSVRISNSVFTATSSNETYGVLKTPNYNYDCVVIDDAESTFVGFAYVYCPEPQYS